MVAAVAITYQTPILTTDNDFAQIDRYFKLPGAYNPLADVWLVEPTIPIVLPKPSSAASYPFSK